MIDRSALDALMPRNVGQNLRDAALRRSQMDEQQRQMEYAAAMQREQQRLQVAVQIVGLDVHKATTAVEPIWKNMPTDDPNFHALREKAIAHLAAFLAPPEPEAEVEAES